MHYSFAAVNEDADENEIPFSAEKRKRKSPVPISQNLVNTVQLRTQHLRPNANDIFGTKTKNKTKMKIHCRPKTEKPKMT